MAALGAAVNIVSTDGVAGRAGFTASAVCSVTDDPPTLLVCINRQSSSHSVVGANEVLCINTLSGSQQELSTLFAGKSARGDRFGSGNWDVLATGAPALKGALANFDCHVSDTVRQGTHDVFFCRVVSIRMAQLADHGSGLIYFKRNYHVLDVAP